VDAHKLMGSGIGWIDAHLLTSAVVAGSRLWSKDRALMQEAARVGVAVTG
jgi:hypothetical protein